MDQDYAQYLLKKTRGDYNLIAEEFSSKRQETWSELKFLFDEHLASGDRMLDLGCGNGRFFDFCRGKALNYTGIDGSEKLIGIAQKSYPEAKFQVADALSLPFPDNHFDKVYSIAVLHHIPSAGLRLRFLAEVKRILRPGGKFVLTVWQFSQFKMRLLFFKFTVLKLFGLSKLDFGDVLDPWGKAGVKRYYHCFSKKELVSLAKKAGFKIKTAGLVKNERGNRQNIYLVAQK